MSHDVTSRRRLWRTIGRLLLVCLVALLGSCTGVQDLPVAPQQQTLIWGEVVRVIDGDTADIRFDGREQRVRLYGIDAPERGHECYDTARVALRGWLTEIGGGRVMLEAGPRPKDRNGRVLAYLWIEVEGKRHFIDEVLVAQGLAMAWRDDGQHRDHLLAAEHQARADKKGCLWWKGAA